MVFVPIFDDTPVLYYLRSFAAGLILLHFLVPHLNTITWTPQYGTVSHTRSLFPVPTQPPSVLYQRMQMFVKVELCFFISSVFYVLPSCTYTLRESWLLVVVFFRTCHSPTPCKSLRLPQKLQCRHVPLD